MLFNALFITFLHLNKAESLKPNSIAEVHSNIFIKPACLGKDLARQGHSLLSAVELHYLRCVVTFGTESRYCKMSVWLPGSSTGLAQWAGLCQCLGGVNLFCGLPAGLGHLAAQEPAACHKVPAHLCCAVLSCARARASIPLRARLCHTAFSCVSQRVPAALPGSPEGAGKHSPEMLPLGLSGPQG